jgi:hypothetical protein
MAGIYFCLLVLFGSFFLLNLILAVIMDAFDKVAAKQAEEDRNKAHALKVELFEEAEDERRRATEEMEERKKYEEENPTPGGYIDIIDSNRRDEFQSNDDDAKERILTPVAED